MRTRARSTRRRRARSRRRWRGSGRSCCRSSASADSDNFFELGGHSLLVLKALFRIQQSFGVKVRVADVYRSPTLRKLASLIGGEKREDPFVDLSQEAALDERFVAQAGRCRVPAGAVLLTGATGFVGRFLLAQLLQDSEAVIYCLVRAQSEREARARLRAMMLKWDLWHDDVDGRVVAVPGDLRAPSLGIDEHSWQLLAGDVDVIYHCGTSMNHLETYAMAKPANVQAARELLRLATEHKPKVINYLSTLGVFGPSAAGEIRVVNETSSICDEKHLSSRGYVASKWVGEQIFMSAAERGIPCNIFRLGLVWADSRRGRYDELQRGTESSRAVCSRVMRSALIGTRWRRRQLTTLRVRSYSWRAGTPMAAVSFMSQRMPRWRRESLSGAMPTCRRLSSSCRIRVDSGAQATPRRRRVAASGAANGVRLLDGSGVLLRLLAQHPDGNTALRLLTDPARAGAGGNRCADPQRRMAQALH